MSEDRDRFPAQNDEAETPDEDVEAHKLTSMNDEPDTNDDDVEAHRLL